MVKIGSKEITHIYQGSNLITDDNSNTKDIKLGNKPVNFVYQGNELLYPNPIKDGLVLYYDMKATRNDSQYKSTLKDISGNNSDALLENFNYTSESGYSEKGLKFDGVDDYISSVNSIKRNSKDISIEIAIDDLDKSQNWQYLVSLGNKSDYNYISVLIHYTQVDVHINNNTGIQHDYYTIENDAKHIIVTLTGDENIEQKVYIDGTLTPINVGEIKSNISVMDNELEFYKPSNNENKTSMKSLRLYDRILTDQEVQQNYQLEKERWGL